jgi:hypothetical protein
MGGSQFKGVRLKKPRNNLGFLDLGFLGMTLAAILLLSSFGASSALPTPQPALPQTAPQTSSGTKQDAAPSEQTPPVQSPPTSTAATLAKKPSGQTQTATTPRFHHQKRVLPPNCDSAPAAAGQLSSGATPDASKSDSSKSDSSESGSTPAPAEPAAKSPPVNCPPKKVIVRQGGISEPSVQLAGSASGDQKSHAQETANQMLESTKANLKKIAGLQLSTNQQDMVNQARQFMEQSKAASDAGDLDRARTLAWKAQLLSEELVKPQQ